VTAPESLALSILNLRHWDGDGVIAALNTDDEAELAHQMPMPVVNISSTLRESPVPRINVDNHRIGQLAADFLMERGFRSFAYYGLQKVAYSKLRFQGYSERLATKGFQVTTLLAAPTFGLQGLEWQQQHRDLADWLASLSAPVALFAVSDYRARQSIDVCHHLGIKVPGEIAVLGVDNEDFICRHIAPQLSSVARDNELEGYQAASALDRMMRGKPVRDVELVPPLEVVKRESTDVIAVSDDRVRAAIEFINEHIAEPVDVSQVARHADVSRRWLEYAFRDEVGESPYQYIRRRRLELVRDLLVDVPGMKIAEIARRTGFTSPKQLTMAFHHWRGMSPRAYRRTLQLAVEA
jgi:LacI family transcriptional regulator